MTGAIAAMPNDPPPIALRADPDDPDDFDVSDQAIEAALAVRRARLHSGALPAAVDEENPEWTDGDFASARPIGDFPALAAAFPNGSTPRRR